MHKAKISAKPKKQFIEKLEESEDSKFPEKLKDKKLPEQAKRRKHPKGQLTKLNEIRMPGIVLQKFEDDLSSISEDSDDGKFKQKAKDYLRKHVKTILEPVPVMERKSRQVVEEYRSNKVKPSRNLLSQDFTKTQNADIEVMSVDTEEALTLQKLTKEEIFRSKRGCSRLFAVNLGYSAVQQGL